jgi:hypothetical protein
MQQKFNVGFCTFSYGGNGGIASEHPDIREWMVPLVAELSRDARVDQIRIWNLADTPITMTRNRAVLQARQYGVDVLVMIDSDMKPDINAGDPTAKPFFKTSFDFLVDHYHKGPCVIGVPYCGPPPVECVYVFRWNNMQTSNPNPDFQLEMYDRHTAVKLAGIQECAALPTGLIMYDMRAFEVTEPKSDADKPWFYYEYKDQFQSEKASTEDVTMTRDLSLVGTQKLGYNPVFCNWDAWAGHWKPKCVGKPQYIQAKDISQKLKSCWEANYEAGATLVDFKCSPTFDNLGMTIPDQDAAALETMVKELAATLGRKPSVLEIGSWAGNSACIMARAGATVHCVDTWEGSKNDEGTKQYDNSRGSPFEVFLKNTAGLPISARIGKSPECASTFTGQYDIVYIDAEHDYDSVMADIAAWKGKAKYILAGHDYQFFPSVKKAVHDSGFVPEVTGNVWRVRL